MTKRLIILGSTGSIGTQTLSIVRENPERFAVAGLAAGGNVELLAAQIAEFGPHKVSVKSETEARRLSSMLGGDGPKILTGRKGACELAGEPAELVVSAMVGAVGLGPTLCAIDAGTDIALANKEVLVTAGELVLQRAGAKDVTLLPIDSEHSAIMQSLLGHRREDLSRIILTASGGPFRDLNPNELERVTPEDALAHPTWNMGPKITIDSASMMNKGLEVIEGCHLFKVKPDRIEVVIHPQSIVHSMVEYRDGSVIAQLACTDMCLPIQYAFSYPERLNGEAAQRLDFAELRTLEFHSVPQGRYPCLDLAIEAAETGGLLPAVMNAANEIAVHEFLEHRLPFFHIPRVIESVMSHHEGGDPFDLDAILEADVWARKRAKEFLKPC